LAAFVGFIPAGRKVYLAFAALAAATQGETSKSYRDLCFACPSNVLGSPADKQTEA